jgi:hypothetical protein
LPAEQAQLPPQPPQVCDLVCPDYEALHTEQVAPHHLPLHQVSPLAHQQDGRLTLKISARHSLLRRYGLRRSHLQQRQLHPRHLQAHRQPLGHQALQEDQPIFTIENNDEDEQDQPHQQVNQPVHPNHHLFYPQPYTYNDHLKREQHRHNDPDLLEWMREEIEHFTFYPREMADIEQQAKEKRRNHQVKFKTFSKFQINSRTQNQKIATMKY